MILAAACVRVSTRATPAAPGDATIVAMVLALNNTDVSYANLANTKAQDASVKTFARRMLIDHTQVNDIVTDLASRAGVVPADDSASLALREQSAKQRDAMRDLEGRAFDVAYMANEVRFHTALLRTIDAVLSPGAHDPQLKQFFQAWRPAVAAHLAHAEQISARLGETERTHH